MHQAERADHVRVAQLRIEVSDLRRQQQAFVDDRAAREGRHVEEALLGQVRLGNLDFGALADQVQLPLDLVLVHSLAAADEDLLDVRLAVARFAADGGAVDGRVAPAEHGETFLGDDALEYPFALQPVMAFHRKERHAHSVFPRRREREAELRALAREELVRDLNQHAGAVAGFRIAATSAAVGQVDQNLNALDDDVVRFLAFDIGYEADTAGVAFLGRVIKTLWLGQAARRNRVIHKFPRCHPRLLEGSPVAAGWNLAVALAHKFTSRDTIRQ